MALSVIVTTLLIATSGILLIPVTLFVYLFIYMQYRVFKFRHIPCPKMSPGFLSCFLGHSTLLEDFIKLQKPLAYYALEWYNEVGPIMVLHFPFDSRVITLTPEAVKELMVSGNHIKDPTIYKKLHSFASQRCFGLSMLVEVDPHLWEVKRNLFNPAFHRRYLRMSMDQFNASSDLFIQRLSSKADGKTKVKLLDEFYRPTMDIICKVGFGYDCNIFLEEESPVLYAVGAVVHAMTFYLKYPWNQYLPTKAASEKRKYIGDNIRYLRSTGRACVNQRIEDLKQGKAVPNDILNFILKSVNLDAGKFGMEELLDEFIAFFIAGMETTAGALASLFLELSKYPEVKQKVIDEINEVMGEKSDIEFDDLHKMDYTLAAIKEALRLHPATNSTGRVTSCDVTINGFQIPKGTRTILMSLPMGRMEKHFPEPEEFRPERFLNNEIKPNTYFPFSTGPRVCIGQQFALIEARVILAKILRKFDFEWVADQSYKFIEEGTLKPIDRCQHYITLLRDNLKVS